MSFFRKKTIDRIIKDSHIKEANSPHLKRLLTKWDLMFFGIAAIVGAGSFTAIGQACFFGGPGVVFLFLFCAVACTFSALCYAEFASRIPTSGSAYVYAYSSFGELAAWVIGWALISEYAFGNVYIAYAWSNYFTGILDNLGIHLHSYLTCTYLDARHAFLNKIASNNDSYRAWQEAPRIGNLRIIFDLPAMFINTVITALIYFGISNSKKTSNAMVYLKLFIILIAVVVGVFYINPANWHPILPNGFAGVFRGVSAVFFAFIGFDAVSTLSEECKDPTKDMPFGMLSSLFVSSAIYIVIALVLTGMISYTHLNVGDPLQLAFSSVHLSSISFITAVGAVIALTSVILVYQLGQPRIWLSMSRDGLLPPQFSRISQRYGTPSFSTIMTGLLVGVVIIFGGESFILDFTSIGTLFAFALVCTGILFIQPRDKSQLLSNGTKQFSIPFINSRYILSPVVFVVVLVLSIWVINPQGQTYFQELFTNHSSLIDGQHTYSFFNNDFFVKNTVRVFWIFTLFICLLSFFKKLSLIPILGIISNLFLLCQMSSINWIFFIIWFTIGLVIYLLYGYKHSNLAKG
ncbi:MAG: amino acid permease [Phycisphaerales bacterium]|nr:amino acid permease [Phycisphaerales bacterium]